MIDLAQYLYSDINCLQFFIDQHLIRGPPTCTVCNRTMVLSQKNGYLNSYIWRCRYRGAINPHDKEVGIYKGSKFEHCHLTARQLLVIIYEWSFELLVTTTAKKAGVSKERVLIWYRKFRNICSEYLYSNIGILGGVDELIQIDESKFMKLKYNRGNPSEVVRAKFWAFGIIDVRTKKCVIRVVRNRKRDTLFPIITQFVLAGSKIWSDEFSVYTGGPNYPPSLPSPLSLLGPYTHQIVNHSINYKDPVTGVHTNNIEATWGAAKRKFKMMNGTRRNHLQSYVDEYCWRKDFIGEEVFLRILELLKFE